MYHRINCDLSPEMKMKATEEEEKKINKNVHIHDEEFNVF